MRIRKRWLLLALPVFAMATGCSEYDHVQNIKLDDVNPEFVLPVVKDKLTLEDMLVRENEEQTNIQYDADGMAYVVYNRKINLTKGIVPSKVWEGSKSGIPMSTTLKERHVFVNVHPYNVWTNELNDQTLEYVKEYKTQALDAEIEAAKKKLEEFKQLAAAAGQPVPNVEYSLPALIQVTEATIAASKYTVKINVTKNDNGEDLTGVTYSGTLNIYGKEFQFNSLPVDEENELNVNNVLNSKDFKIKMDDGTRVKYPTPTSPDTYASYKTKNYYPLSYGANEVNLLFKDIKFMKDGAEFDPKKYNLTVFFKAENVHPISIMGKLASYIDPEMFMQKINVENQKISIFENSYASTLFLPKSSITLNISKPQGVVVDMSVEKIAALFNQDAEKTEGSSLITNGKYENGEFQSGASDLPENSLLIGASNVLPSDLTKTSLVLDQNNSNISKAFGGGVNNLSIENMKMGFKLDIAEGQVNPIPLPLALPGMDIKVQIPFYGRSISNTVSDDLPVPEGAFGSKSDVDQVLKYMAGDEKAKIGDKAQASIDAVTLLFRFSNHMPLDMYASVEFLDAAKSSLLKLRLNAEGTAASKMLDNVPILMEAGKVDEQGKVTAPVVTEAKAMLNKAEFKLITDKAKFVRTVYKVSTPQAGDGKNIGLYKDNYVQMTMAVDLKGRLSLDDKK